MARQHSSDPGIGSCDIYVVKLRNINSQAVSEAIRTIHSLRQPNLAVEALPNDTPRRGRVAKTTVPPAAEIEEPELFIDAGAQVDAEVIDEAGDGSAASTPSARPRRVRHPRGDATIDFGNVAPSLRDFATEKKPQGQFEWYALVAWWLREHKQMPEIGVKQIVAANQFIGAEWGALPADAGQPFRDGCRSSSGIFEQTKRGWYKLTHNGEDRVRRMASTE